MRLRMRDETLQGIRRAGTGREQIQIADGIFPAPQAPRRCNLLEAAAFGKIGNYLISRSLAEAHQESSGPLAVLLDRLQNLLFELRAHAWQFAQLLLFADPLQIVDGRYLMMFPEQGDAFGAESLDSEQFENRRWELLQQQITLIEGSTLADLP